MGLVLSKAEGIQKTLQHAKVSSKHGTCKHTTVLCLFFICLAFVSSLLPETDIDRVGDTIV